MWALSAYLLLIDRRNQCWRDVCLCAHHYRQSDRQDNICGETVSSSGQWSIRFGQPPASRLSIHISCASTSICFIHWHNRAPSSTALKWSFNRVSSTNEDRREDEGQNIQTTLSNTDSDHLWHCYQNDKRQEVQRTIRTLAVLMRLIEPPKLLTASANCLLSCTWPVSFAFANGTFDGPKMSKLME